ncbi:hypothetical protein QBC37DRAFT_295882, partial [Rhypophila decipiens]
TMDQLQDDMRWWFSASNHDVKIVLLVKMHLQNKEIWIEKWQEVIPQGRDYGRDFRSRRKADELGVYPLVEPELGQRD